MSEHECREVEATTYDDLAHGRRVFVCTDPRHEDDTRRVEDVSH